MRFSVCVEMIYPELDFAARVLKVRNRGFSAVEFWAWTNKDLNALQALTRQGLVVTTFSGQRKGSLLNPQDWDTYRGEVEAAIPVAKRLGCDRLMLLTQELLPNGSGRPAPPQLSRAEQRATIVRGLRGLAPIAEREKIANRVKPGGHLVLAGILSTQFQRVRAAFEEVGFALKESITEREWQSGLLKKTGA